MIKGGSPQTSQSLMRLRVLLQFVAMVIIMLTIWVVGPLDGRQSRMVVLNRIYTRTGDDGTTALGTGERRKKYDLRIPPTARSTRSTRRSASRGCTPRATRRSTACSSASRTTCSMWRPTSACREPGKGPGGARLDRHRCAGRVAGAAIDTLNAGLAPLNSFVLPGGAPAAAYLHLARTVCRRAERLMVELRDQPGEDVHRPR